MAESKRILVSLPNTLLDEVDDFVSRNGISRNELVREAMREYVRYRKKLELEERLKAGYKLMAQINLDWARLCLCADNEVF